MAVLTSKPTSPGRRHVVRVSKEGLHKGAPYKPLLETQTRNGGRNNNGRITTRHIGGGHKQHYRIIDFKRTKDGIPATVERIEYDPNRSAHIALLHYVDGEKRYILAPQGLQTGDRVDSGPGVEIRAGNALPLKDIPLGTFVHNIELSKGHGGQMARGAGCYAQLMAKEGKHAQLKLPSGEVRMVFLDCKATIGQVGNLEHEKIRIGKAGRKRWIGRRPHVRGVAMNPVDHPHGGGEGKSSGGRHPVTPWGVPTKGYKTRVRKGSDKLIVKRRK